MDLLNTNCFFRRNSCNLHLRCVPILSGEDDQIRGNRSSLKFSTLSCCVLGSQNQTKRSGKRGKPQKKDLLQKDVKVSDEYLGGSSSSSTVGVEDVNKNYSVNIFPSRSAVLQACTVTSGFIGALGLLVRQVLTSLEPIDYLVVAFLPGIAEDKHLRGGRIIWCITRREWSKIFLCNLATFVGLVYGYTTSLSSSLFVPMASHALNNLVGGIIWRYSSNSSK